MIGLSLKQFTGEIPKSPPNLLPENAASYSANCDYAYGDLRPLKDPAIIGTLNNYNVKSIFTDDGVGFYTWPDNVETVKGPVISDKYRRLYYTVRDGYDTRFVSMSDDPPVTGGKTPVGYKLGVPSPTAGLGAGQLNWTINLRAMNYDTSVPVNPFGWFQLADDLNFKIMFFYAEGEKKYQETELVIAGAPPWPAYFAAPQYCPKYADGTGGYIPVLGRDFQCKVPPLYSQSTSKTVQSMTIGSDGVPQYTTTTETVTGTPENAVPVLHIQAFSGTTLLFSVYSDGTAFSSSNSYSSKIGSVKLLTPWLGNSPSSGVLIAALKYGAVDSRAYVYTYVNKYGEEGKPSAPETIDIEWAQTVEAYGQFTQMGWLSWTDYAPINLMRFYSTNTNSQGNTEYFFNEEKQIYSYMLPAGSVIPFYFALPKKPEKYGERISTTDFDLPPAGCTGFVAMPNGFIAAHVGTGVDGQFGPGSNTLYFSEPYHPHAYPSKYCMTFPWDVVGIRPLGNGLLVTTKGHPYYVYGVHPENMSQVKITAMQAGISKHAMTDVGQAAVYASNDGLVMVDGPQASMDMSQRFFTRQKWRELYGNSLKYLKLAYHDGCLVGYFTNGTPGFVIRLDEATGSFTRWYSYAFNCHYVSPIADKLFMVFGNNLASFADGDNSLLEWQTKEIIAPYPINFSVLQIVPSAPISGAIYVFADGQVVNSFSILDESSPIYYRLRSGFRARSWYVMIDANGPIQEVNLSTSMQELRNV